MELALIFAVACVIILNPDDLTRSAIAVVWLIVLFLNFIKDPNDHRGN